MSDYPIHDSWRKELPSLPIGPFIIPKPENILPERFNQMKIKTQMTTEAEVEISREQQRQITLSYLEGLCTLPDIDKLSTRGGYYVDEHGDLIQWEDWGTNRGGVVRTKVENGTEDDKSLVVLINLLRRRKEN